MFRTKPTRRRKCTCMHMRVPHEARDNKNSTGGDSSLLLLGTAASLLNTEHTFFSSFDAVSLSGAEEANKKPRLKNRSIVALHISDVPRSPKTRLRSAFWFMLFAVRFSFFVLVASVDIVAFGFCL